MGKYQGVMAKELTDKMRCVPALSDEDIQQKVKKGCRINE